MKQVNHFNPSEEEDFLKSFVDSLPSQEIEDYFLEEEADSYLSSLEAHEQ